MSKKDTGLMLSEVKGLLNNLNENLSGKDFDYWLKALKKLLRKEELPEPPVVPLVIFKDFEKEVNQKIEKWIEALDKLPIVSIVERQPKDFQTIINLVLHSNLKSMLSDSDEDTLDFMIASDGTIYKGDYYSERDGNQTNTFRPDSIFEKWIDQFDVNGSNLLIKNGKVVFLNDFYNSLVELILSYQKGL
jgi:hypothetical protein